MKLQTLVSQFHCNHNGNANTVLSTLATIMHHTYLFWCIFIVQLITTSTINTCPELLKQQVMRQTDSQTDLFKQAVMRHTNNNWFIPLSLQRCIAVGVGGLRDDIAGGLLIKRKTIRNLLVAALARARRGQNGDVGEDGLHGLSSCNATNALVNRVGWMTALLDMPSSNLGTKTRMRATSSRHVV